MTVPSDREKTMAAVMAAVNTYLEAEQLAARSLGTPSSSALRGDPWRLAGRLDLMRSREVVFLQRMKR
jgi:hypothetical protein